MDKDRMVFLMEEMVKLQKILVKPQFKQLVDENISQEELKVFEATGDKTRDEIMKISGLSAGAISARWNFWFSLGLLEKDGARYKKVFSLDELGIKIPREYGIIPVKRTELDEPKETIVDENGLSIVSDDRRPILRENSEGENDG